MVKEVVDSMATKDESPFEADTGPEVWDEPMVINGVTEDDAIEADADDADAIDGDVNCPVLPDVPVAGGLSPVVLDGDEGFDDCNDQGVSAEESTKKVADDVTQNLSKVFKNGKKRQEQLPELDWQIPCCCCTSLIIIVVCIVTFFFSTGDDSLVVAVRTNPSLAKQLISELGHDVQSVSFVQAKLGPRKRTALHWAAIRGNTEIVRMLLDKKADVDPRTTDGMTPLHYAARQGHVEIAKVLLENGADINGLDASGWTALHWAALYGREGMTKFLLEAGVDPSVVTMYEGASGKPAVTAFHVAKKNGHRELVHHLKKHMDFDSDTGKEVLMEAK